jgi:hypothetical protein
MSYIQHALTLDVWASSFTESKILQSKNSFKEEFLQLLDIILLYYIMPLNFISPTDNMHSAFMTTSKE